MTPRNDKHVVNPWSNPWRRDNPILDDPLDHPSRLRQRLSEQQAENRKLCALISDKGLRSSSDIRDRALSAMQPLLCPLWEFGNDTGCACACPGTCRQRAEMLLKAIEDAGLFIGVTVKVGIK